MTRRKANSLSKVYEEKREDGAKLQKTFLLPVDVLVVDHDENIRHELDMEHAMRFAHSYKEGKEVPPVYVKMVDGMPHLIEGYHRVTGFMEAQKDDPDLMCIECKEFKGDDVERLLFMMDSSDGKPTTFLEKAEAMNKLNKDFNMNAAAIAKRQGVSHTDVQNKILLAESPEELKQMVIDGKVSATMAVEYITKHGKDALKRLEFDLERALNKGKTKVTAATGSAGPFSAAKARRIVELLSHGLQYEAIIPQRGELEGEVDVELTLDADDMFELIEGVEEYLED